MLKGFGKILAFALVAGLGSIGVYEYYSHFAKDRQIHRLEEEKKQLTQIVQRLGAERRVAEILVTDQTQPTSPGEVQKTTMLFVEYARDGKTPLPPKSFTIDGKWAHIDAMVIKFDRDFVAANDPLRGHSIALFTRLFGDTQAPENGFKIDEPGQIPDIYKGADPRVSQFELELWKDFWKLSDDASYRAAKGVRVAEGQGVWGPFEPEKLYTLTLESDGGLSMTSEPVRGIYLEALKRNEPATTTTTAPTTRPKS